MPDLARSALVRTSASEKSRSGLDGGRRDRTADQSGWWCLATICHDERDSGAFARHTWALSWPKKLTEFSRRCGARWPWVAWGLIVQALGVGSVAVVMWHNIHDQSLGGHITAEMIRFAWHSQLHNRAGLIVLTAGAVVYAAGSVVMARPYASHPAILFLAVPVAAVAGMLLLGVLALVIAALCNALANSGGRSYGGGFSWRNKDRRSGQ
jgi:hypothetical protein